MSKVTKEKIISTAKSLVGVDSCKGACDIMKWYGGFSTAINDEACCCAGMMYLFSKAGALDMIPGGKVANCGTLAVNFYNAGQLHKPGEVKVGDLVTFSWSGATTSMYPLNTKGYKSFDHVELCIAVGSSTITCIGANNGGVECDDFQVKTRYKSNLSACCRPAYADGGKDDDKPSGSVTPNIFYRVRTNRSWLPEVKNDEDYAGLRPNSGERGFAITDIAIGADAGTVKYRVHNRGGAWLPYVTGYDIDDSENGYAGDGKEIDAVEIIYYTDIEKCGEYYFAKYRVSPVGGTYFDWQYDNITDDKQDGYAGDFGRTIDRLQIELVK